MSKKEQAQKHAHYMRFNGYESIIGTGCEVKYISIVFTRSTLLLFPYQCLQTFTEVFNMLL